MFEILFKNKYCHRDIFILKKENKYLMVYRSSGLSGTGHKNQIIPFNFLNSRLTIAVPIIGYFFKEYFYQGKFRSHSKEFNKDISDFLNEIKLFLENEVLEEDSIEKLIKNDGEELEYVNFLNKEMFESFKGLEPFDYSLIEKVKN